MIRTMKSKLALCSMLFAAFAFGAKASDAVQPASCTITNFRSESQGYVSPEYFYEGASLLFTNCVLYKGSDSNSLVQGVNGVTIEVRVGSSVTNQLYLGTAQPPASNSWFSTVTVPTNSGGSIFMQVKVIDSVTNSYIYPWKMINTKAPLR